MDQPFLWDPGYSVNIAELDRHHQRLFRAIAELECALRKGRADYIIGEVLQKLIEHTISHFAAEEDLMQRHGFPGLGDHRADHKVLAQKLTKFNLSHKAGKSNVPPALLVFLQTWLRDHILKTDKEYTDFLNARGVR